MEGNYGCSGGYLKQPDVPKLSVVPCRQCQQHAHQNNRMLTSGTPGCPGCHFATFAAFQSTQGGLILSPSGLPFYPQLPQNAGDYPMTFNSDHHQQHHQSKKHAKHEDEDEEEEDEDEKEGSEEEEESEEDEKPKHKATPKKVVKKKPAPKPEGWCKRVCVCCRSKPKADDGNESGSEKSGSEESGSEEEEHDSDDEECEEEEEEEEEEKEVPKPHPHPHQQPQMPMPFFVPFDHRNSGPTPVFRGAILAGYNPHPVQPTPIDKSYMWGQYPPFGFQSRSIFVGNLN